VDIDASSVLLAPVRVPARIIQALDDLSTLAERARRDPDPVEQARERVDVLVEELRTVVAVARELIAGGADLTETAKAMHVTMAEMVAVAQTLTVTAQRLDATGRAIHDGGDDLKQTADTLHVDTRELIDGGARLTEVSEQLEAHMRTFRAALPRLLDGLDTVEDLEDAVETVADTVEPLQGTAERVGRVTRRLSRSAG
jgi:DNA repair ATPase RecN